MPLHRLHRFFYSTSFTILFLFLFILLLITPADAIVQAYFHNAQLYNVFVIAGTYVLTAFLALAIYISRIYSVRSLMAEIPKAHVPVKKLDLPKRVHKAVVGNLSRSAIIAIQSMEGGAGQETSHPGWSPPGSKDLPDVQYRSVILELPHLIEAKALGLGALGRQPYMTLRAYLGLLAEQGLLSSGSADIFLAGYERARFRTRGEGVEEGEFRELMKVFAGMLRGMGEREVREHEGLREGVGWGTGDEEGSVRRAGFGYGGLGYETTTTDYDDDEEEGEEGGYEGGYEEHYVERERSRVRGSFGGVVMERRGTETTAETSSMGSRDGSGYGIEMQSLSPRGGARRLSVRVSTGTFG